MAKKLSKSQERRIAAQKKAKTITKLNDEQRERVEEEVMEKLQNILAFCQSFGICNVVVDVKSNIVGMDWDAESGVRNHRLS